MPMPERRQIPRTTLDRLAYIHIEPNNGGIVLNVSNDGLCFHCIAAVEKNGPLRFSLLEHNRHIAACGELAWTDEVHKVAGVRFTTLTADARQQVQDWISQPAVPLEEHSSTLGSALLKAFPRFRIRRSDRNLDSSSSSGFTPAFPKLRVRIRTKAGGFVGGLTTGLLVSALWASGFLLYAHRRDLGQSLIHLGERLSGERLSPERPDGEPLAGKHPSQEQLAGTRLAEAPPAAKAKAEKPRAVLTPPMVSSKETRSHARAQAPTAPISRPASVPVRAKTPAENPGKLLARSLAIPAKPQPVLKPQLSARVASSPANGLAPQGPVERSASATAAPAPGTASLAAPIASLIPNKIAAPPESAPSGTMQVHNTFPASAVPLPQMYFELGKFKDELRARDLGDRIAQLGLRPSVVQKGHLWMNAFYVLVGPYADTDEAARTHMNLLSHGYKPRPFERGSRSFTFISGLSLAGVTLPVGDFTINWESYVADAKVKFAQGNYVVATANGQWVKRSTRYQRDEYVYVKSGNGSRLLREIHFSGLDRALVFHDSS